LAATDEPISFERDIKPLFRARDRQSMRFASDLWSHDDVARNRDAILGKLRDGAMPCDGAWPDVQVGASRGLGGGGSARLTSDAARPP
jgi:hypothetical protein